MLAALALSPRPTAFAPGIGVPVRRSAAAAGPAVAPPIVHHVLRGPGRPLDAGTRAQMEPRFRHSFADVRVHADADAAESARAVGAQAYTVGRDVVFGAGRYAPASAEGRRLMAHELAHVVQQRGAAASIQPRLEVGAADDPAEREAERTTDAVLGGAHAVPAGDARTAAPLLRRQPEPEAETRRRPRHGSLPYREATELTRCMQIMGPESAGYCRQAVREGASVRGRGVPPPPRPLRIVLENVGIVRPHAVVEQTVRDAFLLPAKMAGRELELGRNPPGDAQLDFDRGGRQSRPCGLLILGNEGGGEIFVGAHEDLRVCSGPQMDPRTGDLDYSAQLENVFDPEEPAFGRFVGGTAVHELGHVMAQLPHTSDSGNYMHSDASLGANLPKDVRTRTTMRLHWGGTKTFSGDQVRLLAAAMRVGVFKGGMQAPGIP